MAVIFGTAMHQSLVPAFSQLLQPQKRTEMEALFSRTVRMNILGMAPLLASLFVLARPFFTLWAGPEFGRHSTVPFYIMIVTVLFSLWAYVPVSVLIASGRTDILARVYWLQLVPYIALTGACTARFGAVGAAIAWSTRVLFNTCVMTYLGSRVSGLPIWVFRGQAASLGGALLILLPAAVIAATSDKLLNSSIVVLPIALVLYAVVAWKTLVHRDERGWLVSRVWASPGAPAKT